jgi:hypothetical protein
MVMFRELGSFSVRGIGIIGQLADVLQPSPTAAVFLPSLIQLTIAD